MILRVWKLARFFFVTPYHRRPTGPTWSEWSSNNSKAGCNWFLVSRPTGLSPPKNNMQKFGTFWIWLKKNRLRRAKIYFKNYVFFHKCFKIVPYQLFVSDGLSYSRIYIRYMGYQRFVVLKSRSGTSGVRFQNTFETCLGSVRGFWKISCVFGTMVLCESESDVFSMNKSDMKR